MNAVTSQHRLVVEYQIRLARPHHQGFIKVCLAPTTGRPTDLKPKKASFQDAYANNDTLARLVEDVVQVIVDIQEEV